MSVRGTERDKDTGWPRTYRKFVLQLLKRTWDMRLSRGSTHLARSATEKRLPLHQNNTTEHIKKRIKNWHPTSNPEKEHKGPQLRPQFLHYIWMSFRFLKNSRLSSLTLKPGRVGNKFWSLFCGGCLAPRKVGSKRLMKMWNDSAAGRMAPGG